MDKIILGILMLRRLTVYEIRGILKQNFKAMCSDSLGSIQAALKKLLAAQMVTYQEYVEKSVNKKQYSITDKGRQTLCSWLQTPAALSNPKNMELGKLLFMGLVPAEKRPPLIAQSIALLEEELAQLSALQMSVQQQNEEKARIIAYWEHDPEYKRGVQAAAASSDVERSAGDIEEFQLLALQYGIDSTRFQIDWYRALENKVKAESTQNPNGENT